MKLIKRLKISNVFAAILAWPVAGYVWFCFVTTRWRSEGLDELAEELKKGPVIYVLWHNRVMFGPSAWPSKLGQLFTLMDPSPVGQVAARAQAILGMKPISMKANASNFAASRKILQVIRQGHSIGIAADGPRGPQRDAKQAALEWARASGRPVFIFAWSAKRVARLNTWDRLIMPAPFTRGIYVFRRWDVAVPRKLAADEYIDLRKSLGARLDEVEQAADTITGLTPEH